MLSYDTQSRLLISFLLHFLLFSEFHSLFTLFLAHFSKTFLPFTLLDHFKYYLVSSCFD